MESLCPAEMLHKTILAENLHLTKALPLILSHAQGCSFLCMQTRGPHLLSSAAFRHRLLTRAARCILWMSVLAAATLGTFSASSPMPSSR